MKGLMLVLAGVLMAGADKPAEPDPTKVGEYEAREAARGKSREDIDRMINDLAEEVETQRSRLQASEAALRKMKQIRDAEPPRREFGVPSLHGPRQTFRNIGIGRRSETAAPQQRSGGGIVVDCVDGRLRFRPTQGGRVKDESLAVFSFDSEATIEALPDNRVRIREEAKSVGGAGDVKTYEGSRFLLVGPGDREKPLGEIEQKLDRILRELEGLKGQKPQAGLKPASYFSHDIGAFW